MIVGYQNNSYSYQRNIIDILHDTSYKKVRDIFFLLNKFGLFIERATRNKVSFADRNFAYNFIDFNFRKDTINEKSVSWILSGLVELFDRFAAR